MLFISTQKLFSFSRYLSFCLDFLVMHRKRLFKKIKINFKLYDVTAWLTNNCNTHIAQYFEIYFLILDIFSHVCLQKFSVSCICNNDLLDFNRSVAESCCSTGFSCAFSWLWTNQCFLELPVLIPLVLYLIHSLQVSHTWSDFSRLLRVMISEARILCHFILVLLSSTLMKQLTCNVGIISLIRIFGLDI